MKAQKCIVRNKTQLLVAVGCAMDCWYPTEITLIREDGSKTEYMLGPLISYSYEMRKSHQTGYTVHIPELYFMSPDNTNTQLHYETMLAFNKRCLAMRREIRKIPAEVFK
jgi:hypothetical protein